MILLFHGFFLTILELENSVAFLLRVDTWNSFLENLSNFG